MSDEFSLLGLLWSWSGFDVNDFGDPPPREMHRRNNFPRQSTVSTGLSVIQFGSRFPGRNGNSINKLPVLVDNRRSSSISSEFRSMWLPLIDLLSSSCSHSITWGDKNSFFSLNSPLLLSIPPPEHLSRVLRERWKQKERRLRLIKRREHVNPILFDKRTHRTPSHSREIRDHLASAV